jgi:hypothetical protein
MQKIFLSLVIVFTLISCSLSNDNNNSSNSISILGTWTWQKSVGGITGSDIVTPENTGVEKKLIFETNSKVTVFTDDTETGNYTYEIKIGKSIYDGKDHYLLVFNEMTYVIDYIDLHKLEISDNFPDGFGSTYTR